MLLLIPIGGLGTRFSKFGYLKPKPLINVLGKPILFWLFDNLDYNLLHKIKIVIIYNKSLYKYNFESFITKNYPNLNFKFIKLNENTLGAAHTIKFGLDKLSEENYNDDNILCLDSDNFYKTNILEKYLYNENKNVVFTFKDDSDVNIYSYYKTNEFNVITDIKEKKRISNNAGTGAYGFKSWKLLLENINYIMSNQIKMKNEYYTSIVILNMIHNQSCFNLININKKDFICLGTPIQVRLFCNNYPKYSINFKEKIKKKRFCFDLDNTLVSYPTISGDYTSVKPIQRNINLLKYLKKFGHTIIIYTARRMKTHYGNNGCVMKDIGKITFETLDKFNIPYDEIYFGKPYADFYIDDLGVNAFSDLEKEIGFYENTIDTRSFNSMENVSIDIYRKKSNDLSGEIFYYQNIPKEVKDIFPLFLNYDINNKWYEMEKLNGINMSKLYLSGEMTVSMLDVILDSLDRLHKINNENNSVNINIYDNYVKKLDMRYKMIDYSLFKDSENVYLKLREELIEYENNKMGKICMIHGDPVFTNILVNQFGKIKMIDMRGKVGDKLTIYGDYYYDLAKVYQSLIGYDEILEDKYVDENYKKTLIKYFENKYSDNIYKIKLICKSLIFTLIPLHQKNRFKFWNLIL